MNVTATLSGGVVVTAQAGGAPSVTVTVPGHAGTPGDSAYRVAVGNGFTGSEAEWLASLVGPQGPVGPPGPAGGGSGGGSAPWETFTPTHLDDAFDPGTGLVRALRQLEAGGMVNMALHYQLDASSTFGAYYGLVLDPAPRDFQAVASYIAAKDASAGTVYYGVGLPFHAGNTTPTVLAWSAPDVTAAAQWSTGVPFAWAAWDTLTVFVSYEAVSA